MFLVDMPCMFLVDMPCMTASNVPQVWQFSFCNILSAQTPAHLYLSWFTIWLRDYSDTSNRLTDWASLFLLTVKCFLNKRSDGGEGRKKKYTYIFFTWKTSKTSQSKRSHDDFSWQYFNFSETISRLRQITILYPKTAWRAKKRTEWNLCSANLSDSIIGRLMELPHIFNLFSHNDLD